MKQTPLFVPSVFGSANAPSTEPLPEEVLHPVNDGRNIASQVLGFGGNASDEVKDDLTTPEPVNEVNWTNEPFTKAEIGMVGDRNIRDGALQFKCFEVPKDTDALNDFLGKTDPEGPPKYKLIGSPSTLITQAGVLITVWHYPIMYRRIASDPISNDNEKDRTS